MSKLQKYTLSHNDKKDRWDLTADGSNRPKASFGTKAEAIKGGALEQVVGKSGGSVKIQKLNGEYQEERTYPRTADPKKSQG
jgi:Uncharacterized protein conserved in bacteria (DUF2188)